MFIIFLHAYITLMHYESHWALCTAALLPELQPLLAKLINSGVLDLSSHGNNNQTHLN